MEALRFCPARVFDIARFACPATRPSVNFRRRFQSISARASSGKPPFIKAAESLISTDKTLRTDNAVVSDAAISTDVAEDTESTDIPENTGIVEHTEGTVSINSSDSSAITDSTESIDVTDSTESIDIADSTESIDITGSTVSTDGKDGTESTDDSESTGSQREDIRKAAAEILAAATAAVEAAKSGAQQRIEQLEAANERLQTRVVELEASLHMALHPPPPQTQGSRQLAERPSQVAAGFRSLPSWTEMEWPSVEDKTPFWTKLPLYGSNSSSNDIIMSSERDADVLHIIHITAELAPLAKVGGLGDVITGLSRACLARGHHVQVMLPFYDCIDTKEIEGLSLQRTYGSYHNGDWIGVQAHEGKVAGIPVLFLRPENHFFKGSRIYGGSYNELEAYLFFARASLEYMQVTGTEPHIIHMHEWHTAVVGMLYWDMYHQLSLKRPRLALTIHNMEHQGECRWENLNMCGLNGQSYVTVEKALDERTIGHNPERLSLLKGGIVYSNVVTTVSPTYVQETLCSGWMSATLHNHRNKYSGILNGIDTEMWDPMSDPFLPAPFSGNDLYGKSICKHYVQRGFGLDLEVSPSGDVTEKRIPLVVCVTRLVAQKGIHLIRHALFRTLEQGGQFILLGSSPDARIQGEFEALAKQFSDSKSARLILTYSEPLAHVLYAASNMILVPSMFEPCGLTQMIGMRYGSIPVVRKTGGLADTVFDVDNLDVQDGGNGFVFEGIDEKSLESSLDRALRYYKERPEWWDTLTSKAMAVDNSWDKSAKQYLDLYRSVRVY